MILFDRVFLGIQFWAVVCFFWIAVMEPKFNIPLTPWGIGLGIIVAAAFVVFGPRVPKAEDDSEDAV
jgi:hypothetical protein